MLIVPRGRPIRTFAFVSQMRKTNAKVAEWHPFPSVFSPRCSSRPHAGIAGGHFESSGGPFFCLDA